ncbi:DUF5916 domain-containing protein [Roseivirga pacifica]|uniref:DUF5916 domain-containing protein n=1 Tax=Roseivirga pacifica TaxID=1267423 RepID=UPI00227BD9FD|nr:DUF5916 domain-containing protein [Roseivirga pacifica]
MMRYLITTLVLMGCTGLLAQQNQTTRQAYRYRLKRTESPPSIDGEIDDAIWQQGELIPQLMNHWPKDSGQAAAKTEVVALFDDEFVYVMAKLYDNGQRIIQSLRRDNSEDHWNSDSFTFVLDPFNNKQNGFMFGVNAGGAQIEALTSVEGGQSTFDQNWDNKWYSETKQYSDHWVVEMAIPFKTLRYNINISEWGVNFIRADMERYTYDTWTSFPLTFPAIDFNYMGTMEWEENPKKASGKVALIPYLAGGTQRDFEDEDGNTNYQQSIDAGLDAKIALTGSLNLDLTINPDFSNVDVDQQVTNLSRFSIFFPERRNFFLENGDIFSNFGSWQIQPFFSRKIGLIDGQQVPIKYGARLTGNLTPNLRIGAMNMQTAAFEDEPSNNYAVVAAHQKVFERSVIKVIGMNRSASADDYARNGGIEFNYVAPSGKWNNTVRLHAAETDEQLNDNLYYGFDGQYISRKFRSGWTVDVVGENYITEIGFNPRLYHYDAVTEETERQGYTRINPWMLYRFIPENEKSLLNQHGIRTWHQLWLNPDGSLDERNHGIGYDFIFKNTAELRFNRLYKEVNLSVPTNLIGSDNPLPVGNYRFTDNWMYFNTDRRKVVSTDWVVRYGNFFNGTRLGISSGVNFRAQPWGTLGINYDYNKVELEGDYGEVNLHLLRVNAEISFSNRMFWTTAVQYNSQSENYNFFSRFQWRYLPMSDFFVVYTDNYSTDGFDIKNRQLVFKVTYWLNL